MAVRDLAASFPGFSDEELGNLKVNADRLALSGTPAQKAAIVALLPALTTELAVRSQTRKSLRAKKRADGDAAVPTEEKLPDIPGKTP